MSCTYKTISLLEGETFVLPPGAEIVGASDLTAIDSTCPLPELEQAECFGFITFDSQETNDNTGFAQSVLQGIRINGVDYPFSSAIVIDEGGYFCDGCATPSLASAVGNQILGTAVGGAFSDFYAYSDDWPGSGDKANVYVVCFKTIPSLVVDSYIYGYGTTDSPAIPVAWPITKPSEMPVDSRMYAGCPCGSPQ